jgi:hypothetical protein
LNICHFCSYVLQQTNSFVQNRWRALVPQTLTLWRRRGR